MTQPFSPRFNEQPMVYEIKVIGHLGDQWMEWFDNLTITLEADGTTLLMGVVVDQAALHGILKKIRDLGMPLLSVNCVCHHHSDETKANGLSERDV